MQLNNTIIQLGFRFILTSLNDMERVVVWSNEYMCLEFKTRATKDVIQT